MVRHKLVVDVVSANSLSENLELLNPCVQLCFAGQSFTTSIKRKVRCPLWNERVLFDVLDKERLPSLTLEAYVYNIIDESQVLLGKTRLSGANFSYSPDEVVKDYQLKGGTFKRSKGVLLLRVFLKNQAPVSQLLPASFLGESIKSPVESELKEIRPSFEDGMIVGRLPYLFVRVVKARHLPCVDVNEKPDPYVEITAGNLKGFTKCIQEEQNPEWNSTFAFSKRQLDSVQVTRIYVVVYDGVTDDFVGLVSFDMIDIPEHHPKDKPLVAGWHCLIDESGRTLEGDLMLAVWKGSQADEAFSDSWVSDCVDVTMTHVGPKVYNLPVRWCLRVHIIEFKCIALECGSKNVEVYVRAIVGDQRQRTNTVKKPLAHYVWDEEMAFITSEPFEDDLQILVEAYLGPGQGTVVGRIDIPLETVQRRVDGPYPELERKWFDLQMPTTAASFDGGGNEFINVSSCRIHLTACLDSGYNTQYNMGDYKGDLRSAVQEKSNSSVVGLLEVGILGAQGLPPRQRRTGRSTLHPYCVARYGQKWIRTRTIINSCHPSFQEQYSWDVYDTATVLTVGVFDNPQVESSWYKGVSIGKVRIPLSDLQPGRIYSHAYPLLVLHPSGVKQMGKLFLSVRFTSRSLLNLVRMYTSPKLPKMHYEHPLSATAKYHLSSHEAQFLASKLSRMESPLCKEVVEYMCDVQSLVWSLRKTKVNFYRIMSVLSIFITFWKWFRNVCSWDNPSVTLLAHAVFLLALAFHQMILPLVLLYTFLCTVWNYRRRPDYPSHIDIKISLTDTVHPDELDEEYDPFPTTWSSDLVLRMRYDRLRSIAGRIQDAMGDVASCGERITALTTWRDPIATTIFGLFTLAAAIMLYFTPWKILIAILGLYTMRHPKLRGKTPSSVGNFFWRLPQKTNGLL